jgi:hypothetical protein
MHRGHGGRAIFVSLLAEELQHLLDTRMLVVGALLVVPFDTDDVFKDGGAKGRARESMIPIERRLSRRTAFDRSFRSAANSSAVASSSGTTVLSLIALRILAQPP